LAVGAKDIHRGLFDALISITVSDTIFTSPEHRNSVVGLWGEEKMIDQRTAPYAALLLRVSLGLLFIAHLYWKFAVLDGGLDKWWSNFAANGYPAITPWYCISAEFAGALLLIPGIWARWVALYALPLIVGATQFWAVRKGFYFTVAGSELPMVWAVMLVTLALLGDGPYAVVPSPTFRTAVPKSA
jgi:putative oxidoreductase